MGVRFAVVDESIVALGEDGARRVIASRSCTAQHLAVGRALVDVGRLPILT